MSLKIFLLCGSLAQKSHTLELLKYIEQLFVEQKAETTIWDLKTQPLPFVTPEYHKDPTVNPDSAVRDFVATVEKSNLIILGTPLYHGSYAGVLKNALDNLRADAFRGKWIGLVGNAGGERADHGNLSHLRQVVNTLVGYCAQTQVQTAGVDYEELENKYVLQNEMIKKRCQRLVAELILVSS